VAEPEAADQSALKVDPHFAEAMPYERLLIEMKRS